MRIKAALRWIDCPGAQRTGCSQAGDFLGLSFAPPVTANPQIVTPCKTLGKRWLMRVTPTGCLLWVDCTKCRALTESLQAFLQGVQDD